MESLRKAVIYARFSSAKQTEQSIEGQLRVCHQYAQENGFVIVNEYIDRKKSARTDLRPSFQKMLADSYKHKFDFVIVYALDRFARDDGDHGTDKRILQRNGVLLLSATQQIGINADGTENLGGILTEGIYVALAKYYSRELAQKIRRGQNESLEKKQFLGGQVPYGFRVENKLFYINPPEAEVVREIFEMYSKGKSAIEIAAELNERGIKNSIGKPFKPNNIMRMLQNEKYIGTFRYTSHVIENYMPAIVDTVVFNYVQQKIASNRKSPAKAKATNQYLLSGKLFCGYCKNAMVGEAGTGKHGDVHYYYKCSTRKRRKGVCNKHTVRKKELEDLVIKSTLEHVLNHDTIEQIIDQMLKYQAEQKKNSACSILRQQLNEVSGYINNMLDAIKHGIITPSTRSELMSLEEEKADLEQKIAHEELQEAVPLTRERILFWFEQFAEFNTDDENARQYLVTYFINQVIAYDDKIIIIYNHDGDNLTESDISDITDPDNGFGFQAFGGAEGS